MTLAGRIDGRWRDDNLVDALAVHVHHLKAIPSFADHILDEPGFDPTRVARYLDG